MPQVPSMFAATVPRDLNPGGAIMPLFQRYESASLSRYSFAAGRLSQGTCVDFGCGYGFGTYVLAKIHRKTTLGLDIDPRCIKYAKSHYKAPNLEFRLLDIVHIPVETGSVGTFVAFEVLEHLSKSQAAEFFREGRRVLRPDGVIVGSTPNAGVPHDESAFHLQEYAPGDLNTLVSENGFELELLGQGRYAEDRHNIARKLMQRLPRGARRSLAARIAESVFFSARSKWIRSNDPDIQIDRFEPDSSLDMVFVLRRATLNRP